MTTCYGYIRVSTLKQGDGVSLEAQKAAIERHAARNELQIIEWFEERETAAKRGRAVFSKVISLLKQSKAQGLIVHKIDRSARNLRDWADLGELIDRGIELHFAGDPLDLKTRGGRLSADIQAVVAADFIRNLREETRKGFYGRLKQGFYPLPAPLGYLDRGRAQEKVLDPEKSPLVRKAFELYDTGNHSLTTLGEELHRLGLRNKAGGRVSKNGYSVILRNPFYMGLMRIRTTRELFEGNHEPLVPKSLFDRVQARLDGKLNRKLQRHTFILRRLLRCGHCKRSLIGEHQKGHNYYRCQSRTCRGTSLREEAVLEVLRSKLQYLRLDDDLKQVLRHCLEEAKAQDKNDQTNQVTGLKLRLAELEQRLNRLTDVFIDGSLDTELFHTRKEDLYQERARLREAQKVAAQEASPWVRAEAFLELADTALFSFESGNQEQRRQLLEKLTSNRVVLGKHVSAELSFPFSLLANRPIVTYGCPSRYRSRSGVDVPERTKDQAESEKNRVLEHWAKEVVDKSLLWLKQNPEQTVELPLHCGPPQSSLH